MRKASPNLDRAFATCPIPHTMEEEPEPVPPRAMTMLDIPKFDAKSKYNDSPGTGRTGLYNIPPNNYDFYTAEEKYERSRRAPRSCIRPPIVRAS